MGLLNLPDTISLIKATNDFSPAPLHPYAEQLAPLGVARGKLSDAEGSKGAAPYPPSDKKAKFTFLGGCYDSSFRRMKV